MGIDFVAMRLQSSLLMAFTVLALTAAATTKIRHCHSTKEAQSSDASKGTCESFATLWDDTEGSPDASMLTEDTVETLTFEALCAIYEDIDMDQKRKGIEKFPGWRGGPTEAIPIKYEVKPSPGRGFGLFAAQDIKRGEIVHKNLPSNYIRIPVTDLAEEVKALMRGRP